MRSSLSILFVLLWLFAVGHCLAEALHTHSEHKSLPTPHHHHDHSSSHKSDSDTKHANHSTNSSLPGHSGEHEQNHPCEISSVLLLTSKAQLQFESTIFQSFDKLFVSFILVSLLHTNLTTIGTADSYTAADNGAVSPSNLMHALTLAPNAPPHLS